MNDRRGVHPRRIVRFAIVVMALILLLWLIFLNSRILSHTAITSTTAQPSNVLISLAPGQYRLSTSLQLLEEGVSDELYVSWGGRPVSEESVLFTEVQRETALCSDLSLEQIYCFVPERNTTLGEALTIRDLATDHDWDSITVVTSSYHVFRTNYIFSRCLPDVEVRVVAAPTDLDFIQWLYRMAYENVSFIKAVVEVNRDCP